MDDLKTTKYRIVEKGHSTLLIDENPHWAIPMAFFSIAFHSDPHEVLKYGSNGLHFAEHILWNMIANNNLRRTNATTFSTGEMAVYGACLEEEFRKALEGFYGGLADLAMCKLSPRMKMTYKIEQRRVTCETSLMAEESSWCQTGEREKMFVFNTDLLQSQFSLDYVWKILLEECKLGRIIVMANCHVSEEDINRFEGIADKFNELWEARLKHVPKKVPLPVYYAPPFSLFEQEPSQGSRERKSLVFSDDINPIERMIISTMGGVSHGGYPYLFSVDLHGHLSRSSDASAENLRYRYRWSDPFFAAPVLSSYSGQISKEWVDDLYSKSPKSVFAKYNKSASLKLREAAEKT